MKENYFCLKFLHRATRNTFKAGFFIPFVFLIFFPFHSSLYAQTTKISLQVDNLPLEQVLSVIEENSSYKFLYEGNEVFQKKVSIHLINASLSEVLKILFDKTDITYTQVNDHIILKLKAKPQQGEIEPQPGTERKSVHLVLWGTVTDLQGNPLPNATFFIKTANDLTSGTLADINGMYRLELDMPPGPATLVVSHVGMLTEEIPIIHGGELTIRLVEDLKSLEEFVVTGYGSIKKEDYVGAVSTLKAKDIKVAGETSIDQMLQGNIPGVSVQVTSGQVGAPPKVRVRGTSTLLGNQEPVWVVDGVIQRDPFPAFKTNNNSQFTNDAANLRLIASNAISWLNPNDIETITVLKDASATAIYGAKAANGVIVITTKKASKGATSVNYSADFSVGQKPSYRQYDLMNSQERMRFSAEMYEDRVRFASPILPIGYEGLIQRLHQKEITPAEFNRLYREYETNNTDWFGLLFRNSISHNHNVSISAGSDKMISRSSLGFLDQNGEAKGNDLTNYTASNNTSFFINKRLTVDLRVNGSMKKANGFSSGVNPFVYAYGTSRVIPAHDETGNLFYHEAWSAQYNTVDQGKNYFNYNILNELNNTGNTNNTKTLETTMDVKLAIASAWQYQGLFSYGLQSSDIKSYATDQSFAITTVRGYEYNDPQALTKAPGSQIPFGGLLYTESAANRNYTFRNSLTFDKEWTETHRVTVQLGLETRSNTLEGNTNMHYGYLRERGETFAQLPFSYTSSGFSQNNNLYQEMLDNTRVDNKVNNYVSEFFSGIYSYKSRYVFNVNGRMDASNRFGQDQNKKFQPTWSIAGKWRVGNESFFQNSSWLTLFDLSASYGYQGNAVEEVSPYLIAGNGNLVERYQQYTLNIRSLPYQDLGWEKTKSYNFGADISLFDSRVNVQANIFGKQSDVLSSKDVPLENGVASSVVAGTQMINKGYELLVNVTPVKTQYFSWQVSVNTSFVKNEITKNNRVNTLNDYLNGQAITNGKAYSTLYSYEFAGLAAATGTPLFKNMDIAPTDDYTKFLVVSGKTQPDFSGGFNNRIQYKNLSLSALFTMAFGAQGRLPYLYNDQSNRGIPTPEQNVSTRLIGRWRAPGDELTTDIPSVPGIGQTSSYLPTTYPQLTNPYEQYRLSDKRVANTDFVRCRQVSLTYEFGNSVLKQIRAQRFNLQLSMTNPFLYAFDKAWNGIDPETGNWPARRVTSLSLNITF